MEIAGGEPVFPELRHMKLAKDRIVDQRKLFAGIRRSSSRRGAASRCGRERIAARAGWQEVTAVREGRIHEIKSAYILQPGPAALTEGVRQLRDIVGAWGHRDMGT